MPDEPIDRIEAAERTRARPRPQATVEDREFVPGALYHWRRVHGLSQREAQARVGYAPDANTWARWEAGTMAPPYRVLLRILAATGLGHWLDPDGRMAMDPEDRLLAGKHQVDEMREARLARRADRVSDARRRVGLDDDPA